MNEKTISLSKILLWILIGIVLGVTGGLSILRTSWIGYQLDFFFWGTLISTILGVIFFMGNVAQYVALGREKELIEKEKEIHKSQVKVWQHHANGIESGLFIVTFKEFSTTSDMKIAVEALYQVARALQTSLQEERLFSEQEIKDKLVQKDVEQKEMLERARQSSLPPAITVSQISTD